MSGERPTLDFWFDLASNYSYLTLMRIDALAERAGVTVRREPFLLGPIFEAFGWKSSPFVLQKEKGAYVWKDMERQARKYGLPWMMPRIFPQNTVLPVRVALLGREEGWMRPFCQAMARANFAEDRDISSLTLCVGDDGLRRIKERVQRFRRELLELSVLETAPRQVIQVNFQLFPVSTLCEDGE